MNPFHLMIVTTEERKMRLDACVADIRAAYARFNSKQDFNFEHIVREHGLYPLTREEHDYVLENV